MQIEIRLILQFILLLLVQIFVLDNIQFLGFINPMIYVLFILSLPVKFPKWLSLIIAFIMGLIIDIFSNTLGMHAFATVFLAFLRIPLTNLLLSFDDGVNPTPSFKTFGVSNYLKYVAVCVFIHHFVLFSIESFSFSSFIFMLYRIILSSVVTILLILVVQSFKSK